MPLHVLATFVARPDAKEEVRPLLLSLVDPIRRDPGCTRCHLVVNPIDSAEMVFVEEWLDGAALDKHLSDPFIVDVVGTVADLLVQPLTLHRYELLS